MMKRNFPASASIVAVIFFLLLLASSPGFSQQDLSEFEKRLAKINADIQNLRVKIQDLDARESSLLSRLDKISLQKRLIRNEISLYGVQLQKATQELDVLRKNLAELRVKVGHEQEAMEKTLVTLYKYGRFNFLQFLLQAKEMSSLFAESKNLGLLARYQQDIIGRFLKTVSELQAAEAAQDAKTEELDRLVRESDEKRRELEAQEAEGKSLIGQIRKNKKLYEQALAEQKERAGQLQSLMSKLASQEIVLPFRFVPFYEKKGKLPWPIRGRVVTRFGLEQHLNTVTMNNGIEISPSKENLIVSSIHPGKVVYADDFQGYGNLLIIDHGMNYYSLYGHCAEFLVNKGDFVREEQPVAMAGDSGSLQGGLTLYLEIRYRTKPLDPLQWLRRR